MGLCITKQNALVYKEKVRQYWRASTWDIILGIKIGHSEINGKNSLRNILLMRINQKFEITLPHMPTFFFLKYTTNKICIFLLEKNIEIFVQQEMIVKTFFPK